MLNGQMVKKKNYRIPDDVASVIDDYLKEIEGE